MVPKFPQVEYHEATGELREAYDDVQATLRVAWVAFAIRALAVFPGFVPRAWRAAQPNFAIRYAERAADSLRAGALIDGLAPSDPRPRLRELGWDSSRIDEVRRALDALNFGNPKYLLLITAWSEAFQERPAGGEGGLAAEDEAAIAAGIPEGLEPLRMVDPDTASPQVRALMKRAADIHFHHGPSSDYRVLANWPEYLELELDDVLEPIVRGERYDTKCRELLIEARRLVRGFPSPAGIAPDAIADVATPAEISAITGLLGLYQRFIVDVTIDMLALKQAFDGREAAASSPFPLG